MLAGFFIFVLGLTIGSFLNAVIFRLKQNERWSRGRSLCPHCRHVLSWFDLIPLVSFVLLRAKCRYCRKSISWQYPLVELVTALVFVIGYGQFFTGTLEYKNIGALLPYSYAPILPYLAYLIISSFLIVIFVYDLKYYLILDKVSLPAFLSAMLLNFLLGYSVFNLLLASGLLAGFFFLQFLFSQGQWLGGGDIRLGLVMGAILGWPMALTALVLAYVLGAIVGLTLMALKKKSWKSQLPFGTFLSLAAWLVLLWGREIVNWYLGII